VTQHFHSVVLHDFLWRLVPDDIHRDVLRNGRKLFHPSGVTPGIVLKLPIEFTHAAFRFGHSMVRARYRWNRIIAIATLNEIFLKGARNGEPDFRQLHPDWIIDWRNFLDFSGHFGTHARKRINYARKIDVSVAQMLANLPKGERQHGEPASLPGRDLIRGQALGLPSGQVAARQLRDHFGLDVPELRPQDFALLHNEAVGSMLNHGPLSEHTPLWLYLLAEAELCSNGEQLGPVGARIVMEVIHALIEATPRSILSDPNWKPQLPASQADRFTLPDLVEFAGMTCAG
jgi:hypothetical protein